MCGRLGSQGTSTEGQVPRHIAVHALFCCLRYTRGACETSRPAPALFLLGPIRWARACNSPPGPICLCAAGGRRRAGAAPCRRTAEQEARWRCRCTWWWRWRCA